MEVHEGMQQLPGALQNACKVAYVDMDDLPRECRKILRETLDFLSASGGATEQLSAQLAVLLAETGAKTEAMSLVDSLQDTRAFDFRQGFRAVYGDNAAEDLTNRTDNTPLNYMDSSWSAWRFKTRWHRATGATSDADWNEEWVSKRARKKATIVFVISSLMLVIIAVGLALLPWLLRSRPSRFFDATSNSSFSFGEGFGIFVRAEFWGWLLVLLFSLHPLMRLPVLAFGIMTAAPFVALLALRHWRYGRGSLGSFLGIPERSGRWWPLVGAAVCILGLDLAFASLIHGGAIALGRQGHWTEGLDETLIHDAWPNRMVMLANSVLWAPVYEEFAFRGVLFPALRDRVGVFWGALASSVLFSSLHFYGLEGFLSVTAFGFVSALVFHYTRSLVPCIAAHMATNLIVLGTDVALLF
jgi:hypothetical protein